MMLRTESKMIISSASVILEKIDQKLYIPIEYNTKNLGELCLYFNEDKENSTIRLERSFSENILVLQGINFNSPFGNATITPFSIGVINGKEISLQLSSRVIGQEDQRVREITYTLYMENPENEQK